MRKKKRKERDQHASRTRVIIIILCIMQFFCLFLPFKIIPSAPRAVSYRILILPRALSHSKDEKIASYTMANVSLAHRFLGERFFFHSSSGFSFFSFILLFNCFFFTYINIRESSETKFLTKFSILSSLFCSRTRFLGLALFCLSSHLSLDSLVSKKNRTGSVSSRYMNNDF